MHRGAETLCRVLQNRDVIVIANSLQRRVIAALTVQVDCDARAGVTALCDQRLDGAAQGGGRHVPTGFVAVNKHWFRTKLTNRIGARHESEVRAQHHIASLHAEQDQSEVDGRSSR